MKTDFFPQDKNILKTNNCKDESKVMFQVNDVETENKQSLLSVLMNIRTFMVLRLVNLNFNEVKASWHLIVQYDSKFMLIVVFEVILQIFSWV